MDKIFHFCKNWLPDLDLNQDKLNQNQLCYHYTIGQRIILQTPFTACRLM